MVTASRILGDQVGSTAPVFLAFLTIHVIAGLTAVSTGAIAALTRKGSPCRAHPGRDAGSTARIAVVFATAIALAIKLRWRQDYYLVIIGAVAFTAATIGYQGTAAAIVRATPAQRSSVWESVTPRCSPRSTSTTGPTCRCRISLQRRWRSGLLLGAVAAPHHLGQRHPTPAGGQLAPGGSATYLGRAARTLPFQGGGKRASSVRRGTAPSVSKPALSRARLQSPDPGR